jgi:hypothetical protein
VRIVDRCPDNPGVVEVNFMWLPTFIGQNPVVMKEMHTALSKEFVKEQLTEEMMWAMHHKIISWLEARFPFEGIGKYLHAIEEVKNDQ